MTNDLTHEPEADDGFSNSSRSGRVGRGSYLRWNDTQGWRDRDGLPAPSPLLVVGVNEIVRRWKDGMAEDIIDKPLPNPEQLNAAIPVNEWEKGRDDKPRPPWAHNVVVYLVSLATGETYTYAAPTVGAHMAHDALKEAVITMRALRGTKCMPVVNQIDRRMLGHAGVVKLWPPGPQLVVGEGLETVLAAATRIPYAGAPLIPAWAALSSEKLASLPVIPGVERLILLVDNDSNQEGQQAAACATNGWRAQGRTVVPLVPGTPDTDFNDLVIKEDGHAAA